MALPQRPDLTYGLLIGASSALREVCEVLTAERGNAAKSARELGVSHRTIMRWLQLYPELRAAREKAQAAAVAAV